MSDHERRIAPRKESEAELADEITNLLYRLSARLLRLSDLNSTMELILQGSMEIVGAKMGDVRVYDAGRTSTKMAIHRGFNPKFIARVRDLPLGDNSIYGRAISTGERIFVEDTESDPHFMSQRATAAAGGYRSVLCSPLMTRDNDLLGIVSTYFAEPRQLSERELRLLDLYLAHATDTLERIRAVEELQRDEQLYRAIGDSIPYGIWIADPRGRNIYLDNSFRTLTGLSQAEWSGAGWTRALHPEDAEIAAASWKECVRTGTAWEREYRVKGVDGQWHPILARGGPIRDNAGQITAWVGIHLDIGNRVRIRELARRQAQVLEETHDAIFQWQLDGGITHWNRGAEQLYGFTREEAMGQAPAQMLHSECEAGIEEVKKALRHDGLWSGELRHRSKNGGEIVVDSRMVLWRESDNSPIVIEANRDITDRKHAEAALRESEQKLRDQARELEQQLIASGRLVSLGQVTASMAHEFNNPLGVIIGFVEDLLSNTQPGDADRRSLEIISQEAHRCKKIVEDLLAYAKPKTTEMSSVNVHAVVEQTLEMVKTHLYKQKVKAVKHLAVDLPRIHADSQQLAQVLVNLYLNAIDAMPNGGQLTVDAFKESGGTPQVVISVTDTGHGIEPPVLEKIFQPFYTAKKSRGLGLGLPICERIVKNHGGEIKVQSVPGEGTMFEIRLPSAKVI